MSDPIQEGQQFAAAVFGRGPTEPEQPIDKVPSSQVPDPEPETPAEDAPVEDGLITALRQEGKPWAQQFAEMLHPPKGES